MKKKHLILSEPVEIQIMERESREVTGADEPKMEFVLVKYGENEYTKDGKQDVFFFDEKDADECIKHNEMRKKDLVFDFEHSTLSGGPAPASGWGKELIKGPDGLICVMRGWTPKALEYLRNKEYKYHSPVLDIDEETKHPKSVHSVALTNHPAIHGVESLVAASDDPLNNNTDEIIERFESALTYLCDRTKDNKIGSSEMAAIHAELEETFLAFTEYVTDNRPEKAIDILYNASRNMSFSDISEEAVKIKRSYLKGATSAEDAKAMLKMISEDNKDISTQQEQAYIQALIDEINNDEEYNIKEEYDYEADEEAGMPSIQAFNQPNEKPLILNDKKGVKKMPDDNKKGTEEKHTLAEKAIIAGEKLIALADGAMQGEDDLEQAQIDELLAEELPTGDEEVDVEVDVEETAPEGSVEDALKILANALGVEVTISTPEEVAAFTDKMMDAINAHQVKPDKEVVEDMKEKLALSDAKSKETEATMAVDAAMAVGKIAESNRDYYIKRASSDLKAFNDQFGPDSGAPQIVPTSMKDEKKADVPSDQSTTQMFSDTEIEVAKMSGHSLEFVYPERFKKINEANKK